MIIIKMYQNKWQIHLGNEIWQFEDVDEFRKILYYLIDFKDKYGRKNGIKKI